MSSAPETSEAVTATPERRGMPSDLLRRIPPAVVFALSIVAMGIANVLSPGFLSLDNAMAIAALAAFLGVVSIGQTLVVLTGGIDLSVAWTLTAAAVVFTQISQGDDSRFVPAALAAVLVGTLAGVVNGVAIATLGVSPIIMTLGMNAVMQGFTLIYTNGTPSGGAPPVVAAIANEKVAGIPIILLTWIGLGIVVIAGLALTKAGRRVYAVGENTEVSRLTGIRTGWVIFGAYVLSGVFAALAGILLVGFSGSSFLGMGDSYVLPSVAAVVIGGTLISGGIGGYGGTMAGVFFLTVLSSVLAVRHVTAGVPEILYGVLLLAGILLVTLPRRRSG